MIKIGSFLFWEERTGEERIAFEASNGYVVKLWEMFDEEAGLLDGEKVFETDESSTGWMYAHREGQVEADLETGVWKLDLDESAWSARVYEGMETGGFIEEGDDRRGSDEGGREPAARAALAALAGRSAPPPVALAVREAVEAFDRERPILARRPEVYGGPADTLSMPPGDSGFTGGNPNPLMTLPAADAQEEQ